jgi:hypothetical protein
MEEQHGSDYRTATNVGNTHPLAIIPSVARLRQPVSTLAVTQEDNDSMAFTAWCAENALNEILEEMSVEFVEQVREVIRLITATACA